MKQIATIDEGWKASLNVPDTLESPVTAAIAAFCDKHEIPYKVGNSDSEGKGFTAYLGTRERLDAFAAAIEPMKEHIPDMVGPALTQNIQVGTSGKIYARFHPVHMHGEHTQLSRYGENGLPYTEIGNNHRFVAQLRGRTHNEDSIAEWKQVYGILERVYGKTFTGAEEGQTPEWAKPYLEAEHSKPSGFDGFLKSKKDEHANKLAETLEQSRKADAPTPKTGFDMILAARLKEGKEK